MLFLVLYIFRRTSTEVHKSNMTRRPSIQLRELENSFSHDQQQSQHFPIPHKQTNRCMHQKLKQKFLPPQQQSAPEEEVHSSDERDVIQNKPNYSNLPLFKINDLRLRVLSAQKNGRQGNKLILKPVNIPLCLEPQQTPLLRIHHQDLLKNCQRIQLKFPHFFNDNNRVRSKSFKLDFKKPFFIHSDTNNTKNSSKNKAKEQKCDVMALSRTKKNLSQPKKQTKLLLQNQSEFPPAEVNQLINPKVQSKREEKVKSQIASLENEQNNMLKSRIKLNIIKFQPRPLQERKTRLNRSDSQQLKNEDKGSQKNRTKGKECLKSWSNSCSNSSHKQVLAQEPRDQHKEAKSPPEKTPHQQMALFKNKLVGKGNYKLIL